MTYPARICPARFRRSRVLLESYPTWHLSPACTGERQTQRFPMWVFRRVSEAPRHRLRRCFRSRTSTSFSHEEDHPSIWWPIPEYQGRTRIKPHRLSHIRPRMSSNTEDKDRPTRRLPIHHGISREICYEVFHQSMPTLAPRLRTISVCFCRCNTCSENHPTSQRDDGRDSTYRTV